MKKITFLIVFLTSVLLISCQKEEIIDVNLDTAPPKLVIQALINWEKGTTGEQQTIKLTTTTGYYQNVIPVVSGAVVFIKNSSNEQFDFIETSETGQYVCNNFKPVIDEQYTLTVISDGDTYNANATMKSVSPITRIEQKEKKGLEEDEIEIEINAFYDDPENEDNFYLYRYISSNQDIKTSNYVDQDTFFQGNESSSMISNEKLKSGDKIEIKHYGLSKQYYDYMNILLDISGNRGGSFQTPPVKLKGNIVNVTNKDNYPLGYFSLGEVDSKTYIVK